VSEKWYLDHMGIMAFWRTVLGLLNVGLALAITAKVFGMI
tara:strand:+ start:893 stop:1012 length:120 start_codon:yes stop_codon:yes gene_type:complete